MHDNDSLNAAAQGWIARMAQGEAAAVTALYDATLGHVYALALRIVREPDAAEDVVADTFLQAWQQAGRYSDERGTPLAWLLNMTRSRALDQLRRRGAEETNVELESLHERLDEALHEDDPLSVVMALESGTRLRAAIAALSPVAQRLLGLAYFRGLSHAEIARATGLPLGTVKSHLKRAQDALRAAELDA